MSSLRIELAPDFLAELATLPGTAQDRFWAHIQAAQDEFVSAMAKRPKVPVPLIDAETGLRVAELMVRHYKDIGWDLMRRVREVDYVYRRRAIMQFCRENACVPYKWLADVFGIDHSTVIHNLYKARDEYATNRDYQRIYLEADCQGRRIVAELLHTPVEGVEGNTAAA